MSRTEKDHSGDSRVSRLLRSDSLGASVLLLVGLVGFQRFVGLVRNVLFCGMLTDDQLGRWSMTFSFLMLAAPLAVLGVPGSFGRYAEHYRQQGQLRSFLRRTAATSAMAAVVAGMVLFFLPRGFAVLLYDDPALWPTVRVLSLVLIAVVAFNFSVELLTALRLIRVVVIMQLVCSFAFAGLGIGLIYFTQANERAVMIAYGVAALLAGLVGMGIVGWLYMSLPANEPTLGHGALWRKLMPFAGWIWVGNLVGNLFAVSDQFMLKHFSGLPPTAADSLVGQYYCSRVVPLLMVGLASLLASSLLPHLTKDWETGLHRLVARRLNTAVKLIAVAFTAGGALVLIAAPLLFGWVLKGKYDAGLAILPGTLAYCIWFSLYCVAYNYLLCIEKARLGSAALALGLLLNVCLNYVLAPRFGLVGVVFATATANVYAVVAVLLCSQRGGMRWDHGTWLASALPLTLFLGGWPALAVLLIVLGAGWRAGWVFAPHETQQAPGMAAQCVGRVLSLMGTREPAS